LNAFRVMFVRQQLSGDKVSQFTISTGSTKQLCSVNLSPNR